jgi:hypothetical protein
VFAKNLCQGWRKHLFNTKSFLIFGILEELLHFLKFVCG